MKRLHIAPRFTLPLDAITTSSGTFGIRGSGKTNTNVVMVEEFLANALQVAIIDPTDVWWGLKSSKDGTKAGYPILVLGGRHADLPLAGGDGATIADFVVDTGASVILSLRHFEADAEKRRLITDFARRLYHRKGQQDAPSPIMVVVDEASLVVPQFVGAADAPMVGAIQRLVRQGRSSGIGVNLIDARPATVNKDVLAGVEMLITHRVTSPKDRKALLEYVEQHDPDGRAKEFLTELAALGEGEAWFWSPSFLGVFERVKVRERRTFDSSRTPKPGETAIVPVKMADIDLEAVRAKLGQSIEKAKAEDPKELKKEIAVLRAELQRTANAHAKQVHMPDNKFVQQAVDRAVEKERARIERLIEKQGNPWRQHAMGVRALIEKHGKKLDALARELAALPEPPLDAPALPKVKVETSSTATTFTPLPRQRDRLPRKRDLAAGGAPAIGEEPLTGLHLRTVVALAELDAIGVEAPTREQLGFYVGVVYTKGYGARTLGEMKTAGLVEYPTPGTVKLTGAGAARVQGDIEPPMDLAELHARIRAHLSGLQEKVFDALLQYRPNAPAGLSREELGRVLGVTLEKGYGARTLGELKTAGIVSYPTPGFVALSPLVFPDGLL